jgi:hypothetical protein
LKTKRRCAGNVRRGADRFRENDRDVQVDGDDLHRAGGQETSRHGHEGEATDLLERDGLAVTERDVLVHHEAHHRAHPRREKRGHRDRRRGQLHQQE